MESKVLPKKICCPIHPDDIVIRVSLELDQEKLFFCHECLKDYKGPNLIKFQDILKTLEAEYSARSIADVQTTLPEDVVGLVSNRQQVCTNFSEQIAQEKQKTYEEMKKIDQQMKLLFENLRKAMHNRLGNYEESFSKVFEEYSQRVKTQQEMESNFAKEPVKQEELCEKIFNSKDPQEVERNLRNILKEIRIMKEAKSGEGLDKINKLKVTLEGTLNSSSMIDERLEKEYASKILVFQNFLQALALSNQKAADNTTETNEETRRQKMQSANLSQVLDDLAKKMEASGKMIEQILAQKYEVKTSGEVCTVTKDGLKAVKGKHYRCNTCIRKYGDLGMRDVMCESCKDECHSGHEIEYVNNSEFTCQCQFTLRVCKLATCCTYKYTGRDYYRQAEWLCKDDRMRPGHLVCTYCMRQCHPTHEVTFYKIGSAFCDCPSLFNFCKFNSQKKE